MGAQPARQRVQPRPEQLHRSRQGGQRQAGSSATSWMFCPMRVHRHEPHHAPRSQPSRSRHAHRVTASSAHLCLQNNKLQRRNLNSKSNSEVFGTLNTASLAHLCLRAHLNSKDTWQAGIDFRAATRMLRHTLALTSRHSHLQRRLWGAKGDRQDSRACRSGRCGTRGSPARAPSRTSRGSAARGTAAAPHTAARAAHAPGRRTPWTAAQHLPCNFTMLEPTTWLLHPLKRLLARGMKETSPVSAMYLLICTADAMNMPKTQQAAHIMPRLHTCSCLAAVVRKGVAGAGPDLAPRTVQQCEAVLHSGNHQRATQQLTSSINMAHGTCMPYAAGWLAMPLRA